jgi:hypothetical protein
VPERPAYHSAIGLFDSGQEVVIGVSDNSKRLAARQPNFRVVWIGWSKAMIRSAIRLTRAPPPQGTFDNQARTPTPTNLAQPAFYRVRFKVWISGQTACGSSPG